MTSNPLEARRTESGSGGGFGGPMKPGDERIIQIKDKSGMVVDSLTLIRTNRPYADDLADAYSRKWQRDDGARWFPTANGLMLSDTFATTGVRTKKLKAKAERERQRWMDAQVSR